MYLPFNFLVNFNFLRVYDNDKNLTAFLHDMPGGYCPVLYGNFSWDLDLTLLQYSLYYIEWIRELSNNEGK